MYRFKLPIVGQTVCGHDFEIVGYDEKEFPDVYQGTVASSAVVVECAWDENGIARNTSHTCNLAREVLDLLRKSRP